MNLGKHIPGIVIGVVGMCVCVFPTFMNAQCGVSGNLVTNGDFESGNTDFTSDYTSSPGNLYPEGMYHVHDDPNDDHSNFSACGDYNTGNGNMMIVNGAPTAGVNVWCSNVTVEKNSNYIFSTYVTSVHPTSPATLQFSINGLALGSPFVASSTTCDWQMFCEGWDSGDTTSANICIVNQNTAASGNDFALDDIKMGLIAPLYVEMLGFSAEVDQSHIRLDWTTAVEIDHNYFTIERSDDAYTWETIGLIEGKGDASNFTDYQYLDLEPNIGRNYYRLKIVSNDFTYEYSDVRYTRMDEQFAMMKIYPNPSSDVMNVYGVQNINQVQILNTSGLVVYQESVGVMSSELALDISDLSSGVYLVRYINYDEVVYSNTLVKR